MKKPKTTIEKPKQIEDGEWYYKGCIIQKQNHPKLQYKYAIFLNDEKQSYIGGCNKFSEAKKICINNESPENYQSF